MVAEDKYLRVDLYNTLRPIYDRAVHTPSIA